MSFQFLTSDYSKQDREFGFRSDFSKNENQQNNEMKMCNFKKLSTGSHCLQLGPVTGQVKLTGKPRVLNCVFLSFLHSPALILSKVVAK